MATILRYFISGSNLDLLELGTPGSEYTLIGQQVIATGSGTTNHVHAALGVDLDARNLLGGEDVIVFNHNWGDYTKDTTSVSGAIVFTYTDSMTGLTEKVTVLNGSNTLGRDKLIFADGAVLTQNARTALADLNVALNAVPAVDTATKTSTYTLPTPAGNTLRAFGSTDSTTSGATFAMGDAGQTLIATGSGQVDKVYVKAGAVVDARNLLGGEDIIYLAGNWADYTKSLTAVSGAIQFTRTVDVNGTSYNEVVTVLNGSSALGKDKLVFADGAVLTQNVKAVLTTSLTSAITAITGYDAATVTPFLKDIQNIGIVNDVRVSGYYKADETITLAVDFKEAVSVTGTPKLKIVVGGTEKTIDYTSSINGGRRLLFQYVVQAGDMDGDGIGVVDGASAFDLNGVSIRYSNNADVPLDHDRVSALMRARIDTTNTASPSAPAIGKLTDNLGTPADIANGGSSNDATPTLRVSLVNTSAKADYRLQLFDNGNALGSAVVLTQQNIADTYVDVTTGPLPEGAHSFTAKLISYLDEVSSASAAWAITLDLTAPTVSITAVTDDAAPQTGNVVNGGYSNDTQLMVRVSLSDTSVAVGDTVQLFNGSTAISSALTINDTQKNAGYADITTNTLTHGTTYAITARASDVAGNRRDSSSHTVSIDTVAPDAPTIVGLQADTGSSAFDYVTRNGTLLINGLELGAFVDISTDSGSTWSRANGGTASTASAGSIVLGAGSYNTASIRVRQVDAAGNEGQGASWGGSTMLQSARGVAGAYADSAVHVTRLSDGGYVLAWQGTTSDGQGDDIFVQRYNASNAAVGSVLRLKGVSGNYNDQTVQITALVAGSYAVAWQGNTSSQGMDVYIQVVGSNNVAGSVQTLRGTAGAFDDDQAQITALSGGGFVAVWRSYKSTGQWDRDVLVQRFDSAGAPQGTAYRLGDTGTYNEDDVPQVCAMADGGYVVAWQGYTSGSGTNIHAQRFDSAGNTVGTKHKLQGAATSNYSDYAPQVVALSGGGYVLTWYGDTNNSQYSDIFVQRVDGNNQLLGSPSQLHGISGFYADTAPQVAALSGGGYVVVWQGDTSNGQSTDIFVQQYSSAGSAVGSMQRLQGQSGNLADTAPQVTALTGGGYVVVWQGATSDGQGTDIFVQQYSGTGSVVVAGVRLQGQSGTYRYDSAPQAVALADGGYVVTWHGDTNNGQGTGIFSQRFDANGFPRALVVDSIAPQFDGDNSYARGNTVYLYYDAALDALALPDASQFTVKIGGLNTGVTALSASAGLLTLTLADSMGYQQAVTVAYTDTTAGDDAKAVQDLAGNDAASLATVSVTNSTTFTAPVLKLQDDTGSSASDGITSNGTVLVSGLAAGATWQYSTNGGTTWIAGSGSSFTLNAGSTAYDVRVKQTVGSNTTSASGAWSVTVDQTAPTSTLAGFDKDGNTSGILISSLTDTVGVGMAKTEWYGSAILEGTSEANASVTFSIGGQSRSATADNTGYWYYTLTDADFANVDYGTETITVTSASDRAGNTSSAQITRNAFFNAVGSSGFVSGDGYGSTYVDSLVSGFVWAPKKISYSFQVDGQSEWTTTEKTAVASALNSYANISQLSFVEGLYSADIDLRTNLIFIKENTATIQADAPSAAAYAYYPRYDGSELHFDYQQWTWPNLSPGGYGYHILVHEIGHALGLEHPFHGSPLFPGVSYGDTESYGDNNLSQDIWTVESYHPGWKDSPSSDYNYANGTGKTPMTFDVAAIQATYGTNTTYKTGNDTYTLPTTEVSGTGWECIWDAGGTDTITNAGSSVGCTINLNAYPKTGGVVSEPFVSYLSGGSIAGGFTIADGVIIENAIGGNDADTLTGNAVSNVLTGNGGADEFVFNTALGADNIDTITDLMVGTDKIALSKAIFTVFASVTSVATDQLRSGAGIITAADSNDYLIYNISTGALYYDADGAGSAFSALQFAVLQNKAAITNASFAVL